MLDQTTGGNKRRVLFKPANFSAEIGLKVAVFVFSFLFISGCTLAAATEDSSTPTPDTARQAGYLVSGLVLEGGPEAPPGLEDAPIRYVYEIVLAGGSMLKVAYTAYPPSPVGEARPAIILDFHAGEILPGDAIEARGSFDPATNTLYIEHEGDYIKTQPGS